MREAGKVDYANQIAQVYVDSHKRVLKELHNEKFDPQIFASQLGGLRLLAKFIEDSKTYDSSVKLYRGDPVLAAGALVFGAIEDLEENIK